MPPVTRDEEIAEAERRGREAGARDAIGRCIERVEQDAVRTVSILNGMPLVPLSGDPNENR